MVAGRIEVCAEVSGIGSPFRLSRPLAMDLPKATRHRFRRKSAPQGGRHRVAVAGPGGGGGQQDSRLRRAHGPKRRAGEGPGRQRRRPPDVRLPDLCAAGVALLLPSARPRTATLPTPSGCGGCLCLPPRRPPSRRCWWRDPRSAPGAGTPGSGGSPGGWCGGLPS